MKIFRFLPVLLLVLFSCKEETNTNTAQNQDPILFDGIDDSIKPGDDFFNHVNKTWFDNAVIADDQVGVGAYRFLNIPQQELLKNILEDVSQTKHPQGSVEQKVGDFYASGMDTLSINKRGITPIQPILDRIAAIENVEALIAFVANQLKSGDNSMFAPYVSPDQKNSTLNILHVVQTGLGLPDRDYYFMEDPSVKAIQDAYKTYLTRLFELVGDTDAQSQATAVYAI